MGHWGPRSEAAQAVKALLRAEVEPNGAWLYDKPVDIWIKAYFETRAANDWIDSSNIPAKLYEDALKDFVIIDDTPEFVHWVCVRSICDPALAPRVEILVVESGEA